MSKPRRAAVVPKPVLELLSKRLAQAQEDYESWRSDHGLQ
jgi:hypothetical protein